MIFVSSLYVFSLSRVCIQLESFLYLFLILIIVFYRAATGTNVTYLSTIMSAWKHLCDLNRRKNLNKEIIEKFALYWCIVFTYRIVNCSLELEIPNIQVHQNYISWWNIANYITLHLMKFIITWFSDHRHTEGGGGGVQNTKECSMTYRQSETYIYIYIYTHIYIHTYIYIYILLVRQFLLKSRAIFLFTFCFTNILDIFFSFVTCSMHKNPHQNVGIRDFIFQNFSGEHALDPARGSRAFSASRANSCLPPKISKPVRLCLRLIKADKM